MFCIVRKMLSQNMHQRGTFAAVFVKSFLTAYTTLVHHGVRGALFPFCN
jgi:hypothetical protein